MTTTGTESVRWYTARERRSSEAVTAPAIRIEHWSSKALASGQADQMYRNGITAPLVIAARDAQHALDKARRCWAGKLTTRQAASPRIP